MRKIKNYVRHPMLTDKPLVLYPAGEYGEKSLKALRHLNIEPIAFCDGDQNKSGKIINGIVVRSLKSILSEYGTTGVKYLINSAYNYPQIESVLWSHSIPPDCILTPDIFTYCDTGIIERPIQLTEDEHLQLKNCLLDLLVFFHNVCEKYEIPYYITSGTLLGAIRHKGFIPWDDDIDVAMARRDYNKFYRVVKKELGEKYAIQDIESRKNLALQCTKWQLFTKQNITKIMIDTFPIDNVFCFPNRFNRLQENLHLALIGLGEKYKWYDSHTCTNLLGRMFRGLGIFIIQLCNVTNTGYLHYFVPDSPNLFKNRVYAKSLAENRILVEFEGYKFYAPEKYDDVLRQMYGNSYMELPPQDKQVPSHATTLLVFNVPPTKSN